MYALISSQAAEAINETYLAGGNFTVWVDTFLSGQVLGEFPSYLQGQPDPSSAWGPLNDLYIKPDIAAPTGNILGPAANGQWLLVDSTWAATPYIAGVAALYIGQYGGRRTNAPFKAADLVIAHHLQR